MLAEYMATFHREDRVLTRVRLGPIPQQTLDERLTEPERRMIGSAFRRWADAIILRRGVLVLVEAAMIATPGDISILQVYRRLVPHTPELLEWHAWPVGLMLLWSVDDPYSRQVAVEAGIEVRLYRPTHFNEWLTTKRGRESGPRKSRALVE